VLHNHGYYDSIAAATKAATPATVRCEELSVAPEPVNVDEVLLAAATIAEVAVVPAEWAEVALTMAPVLATKATVVLCGEAKVEVTVPTTSETVMVLVRVEVSVVVSA